MSALKEGRRMLGWGRVFVLVVCGTILADATAAPPQALIGYPRDDELKFLPPYCTVRLRKSHTDPEYQRTEQQLGPDFIHTHHHCAGLNFLRRYFQATTPQDRRFVLTEAVSNFNYMVAHAKPSYVLMPDVYLNRGRAYVLQKKDIEALRDFHKAIELDPTLVSAYTALADHYQNLRQTDKAIEVVTEGLRNAPNSRSLMRRYDELGGKKPYPEPYAKPEQKLEERPAPTTEVTPQEAPKASDPLSPAAIKATRETATPERTPPTPGAAGASKRNPYCRFCPEEDRSPDPPPSMPPGEPKAAP